MRAILEQDFLTFAKTKRYFVLRSVVVGAPLVFLLFILSRVSTSPDEIGQALFYTTAWTLLATVVFATPAMTAHVLAEEKRNNKLEVLRSSPLSAISIVLGKWLSRVGHLMSVVLAATPLMAASLIYGGVAPRQFLYAVMVCAATVLAISAVCMVVSAGARDLGQATKQAFALTTGGLALGWILSLLPLFSMGRGGVPGGTGGVTWPEYVMAFHPIGAMAAACETSRPAAATLHGLPVPVLFSYAAVAFTIVLLPLATWRFVREGRAQGRSTGKVRGGDATKALRAGAYSRYFRLRENRPALWVEILRLRKRSLSWGIVAGGVLLIGVEWAFLAQYLKSRELSATYGAGPDFLAAVHLLPTVIAFGMSVLSIASVGAAAFHRDNEARTVEVLRSTPLSNLDFIQAKLGVTLWSARAWILMLIIHTGFGVVMGDLSFFRSLFSLAIVSVLLTCLALFSLSIGLRCTSIARATVRTIGIVVAHTMIWPFLAMLMLANSGSTGAVGLFIGHHPLVLSLMPFWSEDVRELRGDEGGILLFSFLYLAAYLFMTFFLYGVSLPEQYAKQREDPHAKKRPPTQYTHAATGAAPSRGVTPETPEILP